MREQSLGGWKCSERFLRQPERAMQEAARPRGINDKLGGDLHRFAAPSSGKAHAVGFFADFDQHGLIQISYAEFLCLGNQVVIEVGAIPMGVSDFFVRTRADEKLIPMFGIGCERLSE